jgi:hypothetical protein
MNNSPYEPPQIREQTFGPANHEILTTPPQVWTWYKVYCGLMLLLYVMFVAGSIFLFMSAESIAVSDPEQSAIALKIQGAAFGGVALLLVVLYSCGLFFRPSKMAWYLGFATIGIGLTSACCLPASVPLLIFWLKQETRVFLRAMPGQN